MENYSKKRMHIRICLLLYVLVRIEHGVNNIKVVLKKF